MLTIMIAFLIKGKPQNMLFPFLLSSIFLGEPSLPFTDVGRSLRHRLLREGDLWGYNLTKVPSYNDQWFTQNGPTI